MQETEVWYASDDHHGRSYKIQVTEMSHITTRTRRHVKITQITAEEHLRNEVSKEDKLKGQTGLTNL